MTNEFEHCKSAELTSVGEKEIADGLKREKIICENELNLLKERYKLLSKQVKCRHNFVTTGSYVFHHVACTKCLLRHMFS